ncbi:hypothetical protein VNI00_010628 [Paramarasmius palmivorus]|uniref:FAD-binding PCMH-type domain-containing protein n=1 Tax=Paramarasmius palmivorus TaxID=297713 RepID=A0AAW0CK71_9AGAR
MQANSCVLLQLRVVAASETRSPFAIKGGGHIGNAGFSSTLGVQISMSRFDKVDYDKASSTVKIGAGLFWDDVYARLMPDGVKVVGGRVPGVGVGGLLLGGGYSYFSDQYGLSVDSIVSHDLVLPNGTAIVVTEGTDADLFFALKVASIVSPINTSSAVNQAVVNWNTHNKDLKANMPTVTTSLLYDAPMQPLGIFDEFFNVPGASVKASGVVSLPEAMEVLHGTLGALNPPRTARNTLSASRYTMGILDEVSAQLQKTVSEARANNRSFVLITVTPEPFLQPNVRSTDSAYPHPPGRFVSPSILEAHYADPTDDDYFVNAIYAARQAIQARAIEEGQSFADDILYNNYAPADTPLELLYGNNLDRLREIRTRIDPENVMELAGGFKIK